MKLTPFQRRLIVVIIAALFILYGVAGMVFKFNFDKSTTDNINNVMFVLMLGAAYILFGNRRKKQNQNDVPTSSESEQDKIEGSTSTSEQGPVNKTGINGIIAKIKDFFVRKK